MGFLDLFGKREPRDDDRTPRGVDALSDPAMQRRVVIAYHDQSKHDFHRSAAGPYELDWDSQPDPFRRWIGAPTCALETSSMEPTRFEDPTSTANASAGDGPRWRPTIARRDVVTAALDRRTLSQFFFDSMAISAWKQAGSTRWALRVDPSSGNLHPTEAYAILPPVDGVCAHATVAHYAPKEHALELRLELSGDHERALLSLLPPGAFLVVLTSIHWREAWKYGERAFRYCQHDTGHAIGAVSIAASALGWTIELVDEPSTAELRDAVGLHAACGAAVGPEAEHPECLLLVRPSTTRSRVEDGHAAFRWPIDVARSWRDLTWNGRANELSPDHVEWSAIDLAAQACDKPRTESAFPPSALAARSKADVAGPPVRSLVRRRRSAQSFDGRTGVTADDFYRVLESTMPRARCAPFDALPWTPRVHLALFVHRVEGLHAGLYWLQRDPERASHVRAACRDSFLWETPTGCPKDLPLSLLVPMDMRRHAVSVSCGQDIAGDGAFSLGMVVEFERALEELGAWFYPRLFWETGAVGQVLYLEAEAIGRRGTGIGCFFDDPVHSILGVRGRALQSLYHFTVGQPVEDARLTTLPAYPEG